MNIYEHMNDPRYIRNQQIEEIVYVNSSYINVNYALGRLWSNPNIVCGW